MRSTNKLIFVSLLIFSFHSIAKGQPFEWQTGIYGFFDNREFDNQYAKSQTLFGTQMFGSVKMILNRNVDIGGGLNVLYEFGGRIKKDNFKPVLYVHFNKEFLNYYFGAFTRNNLITLPLVLQSDTVQYYRPNCEGMYVEFRKPQAYQSIWLDWTSRQADTIREAFQIGGTGIIKKGIFFYRHDFIMTHYARPAIQMPNDYIRDNGGLYARIGVDVSPYLFDSLTISTGYCFSYDRIREVYDLTFYHGSLTQIYIEMINIGLRASIYLGDGQLQLWGDKNYRARYYNRFDLVWHFFRKKNIRGSMEFSLHVVDNILDVSQSFKIRATLDGSPKQRLINN